MHSAGTHTDWGIIEGIRLHRHQYLGTVAIDGDASSSSGSRGVQHWSNHPVHLALVQP